MMHVVQSANLGLRFVLELGGIAALGFYGFQLDRSGALRWVIGLGAPFALIVIWSTVVAPGAANGLSPTTKMWIGSVLLGAAALALAAAQRTGLAVAFGVAVVLNALLMQVWQQ